MTSSTVPEWDDVLTQPRRPAGDLRRTDIPDGPGAYAWFRNGACVYLGKASDLRSRLSTHLGKSLDLNRSTLRSWVAVRELGVTRAYTRRRPTVMTSSEVAVVTGWIRSCDVAWVTTDSKEDDARLESKLLAAWRPPINVA
ncbi:GIY-YIG nuclease family protein [Microbacterium excoecariae]|uniref:GIY-YIG nuclease family protein n=1 Tax=Microbacterium excoecariae TaxID=2715210 RepID=UPI003B839159